MKTELEALKRIYPTWSLKPRRILANCYRHNPKIKWLWAPWALMMLLLSLIAFIWIYVDDTIKLNEFTWHTFQPVLPLTIGAFLIFIGMIYFAIWPLSWYEMYDWEKVAYRILNDKPNNWNP